MINQLYQFVILFFVVAVLPASAQRTVDYIPSDVSFAVSLHPGNVNEKVNIREVQQMGFYQMLVEQVSTSAPMEIRDRLADALTDPTTIGVNDLGDMYFFGKLTPEVSYFGFALGLTDGSKFSEFLRSALPEGQMPEQMDGYQYYQPDPEGAFAWNDRVLIIAGSDVKYSGYDEYGWEETVPYEDVIIEEIPADVEIAEEEPEPIEEAEDMVEIEVVPAPDSDEWEEEAIEEDEYPDFEPSEHTDVFGGVSTWDLHKERESDETASWVKSLISRDFPAPLQANLNYTKATAAKTDFNIWMDYNSLMDLVGDDYSSLGMASMGLTSMMQLYEDMFFNFSMNFEDGVIDMDTDIYGNEEMTEMWRASYDSKYDKKHLEYIDGSNLLAYMTFNLNMEGLGESMKDLMYPIVRDVPGAGETAVAGLDVLGILVDDEALYNLFTGDVSMAVTGIAEFEKTITTYEYDDDFNATEKEITQTDYFPEFTMMASYGNEENVGRLVRLLETTGLTQNMGNFLSMNIPDVPGEFYLAMHDDILFFSNDIDLMSSGLENGIPKDLRLAKSHKKRLKKSASVFFWDLPQTLEVAAGLMGNPRGMEGELFNVGKQNFENIIVAGSRKVKDSYHTDMTITMTDDDTNSFRQIVELINDMVMDMMGGDSRS